MEFQKREVKGRQVREFVAQVKAIGGEDSRTLEFIASTEVPDRSNDIIEVAGWITDHYLGAAGKGANPVFAWAHDYSKLPVGKTIAAVKDLRARALIIRVYFPTIEELSSDPMHPSEEALFADTVYRMYKNGMLSAVSVGFNPVKFKRRDDDAVLEKPEWERGYRFLTQELLEVSAVLVPCNPEALIQARGMKSFNPDGLRLVESAMEATVRAVVPFKHFALAAEDVAWDAAEVIKASDADDLRIICTWYDGEKKPEELTKGDFKLPHHLSSEDGYKTVWEGVKAAMGALFGARGGAKIQEAEQERCYKHLAKHYEEFKKEPPEWGKSYSAEEVKALFGKEGTMGENPELKALEERIRLLEGRQVKAGAKFSGETKEKIGKVVEALKASHKAIKGCHEALEDLMKEGESDSGTEGPKPNVEDDEPDADDKGGVAEKLKSLDLATASLEDALKAIA